MATAKKCPELKVLKPESWILSFRIAASKPARPIIVGRSGIRKFTIRDLLMVPELECTLAMKFE